LIQHAQVGSIMYLQDPAIEKWADLVTCEPVK
jgi:aryl carrier-like protein